jgi:hypothetical protein
LYVLEQLVKLDIANNILKEHKWLLLDISRHDALYLEMNAASFADSPFLDHRLASPPDAGKYTIKIREILDDADWQQAAPTYPTRYIQHISHVGSTLISRALGIAPKSLALREPLPLRYLGWHYLDLDRPESGLPRPEFMRLLDFTLRSLGRPLGERTEVVIKTTSWANAIAPLFLDPNFGGPKQVVGVYTSLDRFVANTLKGETGRKDLELPAPARIRRLHAFLPEADVRLSALRPGELAAMTWLCEMLSIHQSCAQQGAALRWVDFDRFLESPVSQTAELARHLKLDWPAEFDDKLAQSGILSRYSKLTDEVAFSAETRDSILNKYKNENSVQLTDANLWLDRRFQQFPWLSSALHGFR